MQQHRRGSESSTRKSSNSKTYKSFFRKTLHLRRRLTLESQDRISRTNSTSSRLLRLPSEIRYQIFTYVIGGNVVDVSENPKPNSRTLYYAYNICANDRLCMVANLLRTIDAGRHVRIRATQGGNITCSTGGLSGKAKRWLALLFVCRQIYQEAKNSLWSENLLYFWSLESLWWFTGKVRLPEHTASIRSLALVVDPSTVMYTAAPVQNNSQKAMNQWSETRVDEVIARLSGLKVLYLLVQLPVDLIERIGDKKGKWKSFDWLRGLMHFKQLTLREVKVIVELPKHSLAKRSEGSLEGVNKFRQLYQITDQDCRKYATELERALLGKAN